MTWPTPEFSRSQVNRAGEILVREMKSEDFDIDQWMWAFDVLSNWRACHGYPERANAEYMKAEKRASDGEHIQVVLVSAGSIDSLRRAYPNYFLDTHDFLRHLKRIEKAS